MTRQRIASVIGLPAENVEEYERLHAEVWPDVLARIAASNVTNYSIYRHGDLLFSYFEYVGDDYEADMAAMAADPRPSAGGPSANRCSARWPIARPGMVESVPEAFHID